MDKATERRVQVERRYQSVVLSLCAGCVLWILSTLLSLNGGISRLQARIDQFDVQLALMYRASDARRDMTDLSTRITSNDRRIERLEQRLEAQGVQ